MALVKAVPRHETQSLVQTSLEPPNIGLFHYCVGVDRAPKLVWRGGSRRLDEKCNSRLSPRPRKRD